MGLSQDLGADLVYPSPAWPDRGTQLPGSLHRFPAFASFSGPPLFPRIAFFLSASLSENLDLAHSKCSKTLRCCESVFMPCCVLLSPSLPLPFLPFLLVTFSSPWRKLTEADRESAAGLPCRPAGRAKLGTPVPAPLCLAQRSLPGTAPTPNLQRGLCTSFCQQLKQIN